MAENVTRDISEAITPDEQPVPEFNRTQPTVMSEKELEEEQLKKASRKGLIYGAPMAGAGVALGSPGLALGGVYQMYGPSAEYHGGKIFSGEAEADNVIKGAALTNTITAPFALAADALGIGIKTGKHEDQKRRDIVRGNLQKQGVLGPNYTFTTATGGEFDFGKDGGAKLSNNDGVGQRAFYQIDQSNPISGSVVGMANPIAVVMTQGHQKLTSDYAGYLTNMASFDTTNWDTARNSLLKFIGPKEQGGLGWSKDFIEKQLALLRDNGNISEQEYQAYLGGVDSLFNGTRRDPAPQDTRQMAEQMTVQPSTPSEAVRQEASSQGQFPGGSDVVPYTTAQQQSNTSSIYRPENGAFTGANEGFLWKPQSESNGNLVVLLPSQMPNSQVVLKDPEGNVIDTGVSSGRANGGREHFRFNQPGSAYAPNTTVEVTNEDGTVSQFMIEDPSQRYGLGSGGGGSKNAEGIALNYLMGQAQSSMLPQLSASQYAQPAAQQSQPSALVNPILEAIIPR